jgi:hypothetical protein
MLLDMLSSWGKMQSAKLHNKYARKDMLYRKRTCDRISLQG